jgi:medium-chain acyl-[acyl-carrier-protein] hydrolase
MTFSNGWVVRQRPQLPARLKLFCFPYAGGGASAFRNWANDLRLDVEVCCIQLPGRENRLREPPFRSLDELIPVLVEGILGEIDRPFAFYGHSFGAKIAFEAARELRRKGIPGPFHVFAGASLAPHVPWPHPPTHTLAETDFIDEIQRRYGAMPRQVIEDPELRALLIPTLRADLQLVETSGYKPGPPLECAITVFGGMADNTLDRADLEVWQHQTLNTFRLHMLDGDHFFLQSDRQALLDLVRTGLMESFF